MPLYKIYNYIKNQVEEIDISDEDLETLSEAKLAKKYFGEDPEIKTTDCECGAKFTSFPKHHSEWCIQHVNNTRECVKRHNNNLAVEYKRRIALRNYPSGNIEENSNNQRKYQQSSADYNWYDLELTSLDYSSINGIWSEEDFNNYLDNKIKDDFDSGF